MSKSFVLWTVFVLLGACTEKTDGDDEPTMPDAEMDAGIDARAPHDSGQSRLDSGSRLDSSPPLDASKFDAGNDSSTVVPDTGVVGIPDAATADAGWDAGPPDSGWDAGPQDSGWDAGPPDAGWDAGPPDAGWDGGPPDSGIDSGPCTSNECSCVVELDGDTYLRDDGQAVYWRFVPTVPEVAPGVPLTGLVEIADGWRHTCALKDDGSVWCWAKTSNGNDFGELGNGTIGAAAPMVASQVMLPPVGGNPPQPLQGVTHLSDSHSTRCYIAITTCAVVADGSVYCWGGDNSQGGTGSFFTEGTVGARPYATQLMASATTALTGVAELALGLRHACAITTGGNVLCWGMNVGGPLGQGDQMVRQYPTPVPLPGGALADEIGAGADFTCVRSGGTAYCWGLSGTGAIGLGDPTAAQNHDGCINWCRLTPAQVIDQNALPLSGAVHLEVTYQGACIRKADHQLHCWGGGTGHVAAPLVIPNAPTDDVDHMTTCSTTSIPTAIRYLSNDGTLRRGGQSVSALCQ